MPSQQLPRNQLSPVPRFSVIATYAHPGAGKFVGHVAVLRETANLSFGSQAPVWHTRPPTLAGGHSSGPNYPQKYHQCAAHMAAYLDDLTPDDVDGIETTLAEIDAQTQPTSFPLTHYVVHPPMVWVVDEKTKTRRFRKFSCVGFVLECYQQGADRESPHRVQRVGEAHFPVDT